MPHTDAVLVTRGMVDIGILGAPLVVSTVPIANPTAVSGTVTAPTAALLVADTGALGVGTYYVEIAAGFSDVLTAGKGLDIQHRNADNNGNIATLSHVPAGTATAFTIERIVIAALERVRVVNGAVVGAAGSVAAASIRAYLLSV